MDNVAAFPSCAGPLWRDYVTLAKPRVSLTVAFTAATGAVIAPGDAHPAMLCVAVLAVALASGASGAFNMWYERRSDALMKRTANRPLPAGRMAPESALIFSALLALFSVMLMVAATNGLATLLLIASIISYCFIYTVWLKPYTPQNIVIGGIAGAIPPAIGWAAATGEAPWQAWTLVAIIFMWTPAHFWALALAKSDDYKNAGIPMMPLVAGRKTTIRLIALYGFSTIALGFAPALFLTHPLPYLALSAAAGIWYADSIVALLRKDEDKRAIFSFLRSIAYLFAVFIAAMACA
ncbi:MAG: heme o synthase [Rickettsiales bacterium]